MPLPCPQCKQRAVDIRQYEIRTVDTDTMKSVSSRDITDALCAHCGWRYVPAEAENGLAPAIDAPVDA